MTDQIKEAILRLIQKNYKAFALGIGITVCTIIYLIQTDFGKKTVMYYLDISGRTQKKMTDLESLLKETKDKYESLSITYSKEKEKLNKTTFEAAQAGREIENIKAINKKLSDELASAKDEISHLRLDATPKKHSITLALRGWATLEEGLYMTLTNIEINAKKPTHCTFVINGQSSPLYIAPKKSTNIGSQKSNYNVSVKGISWDSCDVEIVEIK